MHSAIRMWGLLIVACLSAGISMAQGENVFDVQATPSHLGATTQSVFTVDREGGFVAYGFARDVGNTTGCAALVPATGVGTRFMWHPCRASVRFGRVPPGQTSWDDSNMDDFTFAGGNQVIASDYGAFAYGDQVTVSSTVGVGFGSAVTVSGTAGFSAGASNTCSGFACTAIGYTNSATGLGSVALGYRTSAFGDYTVALGHRATTCSSDPTTGGCPGTAHTGSFVWGDESTISYLKTTADNQFSIRAAGGVRMLTNAAMNIGVSLAAGGSSWNVISDRNLKESFQAVDENALLDRIATLPLSTWRFKDTPDGAIRHIGPMAQDWQQYIAGPLGLNSESTMINQGDFDGVNLAAVKALDRRTRELETENEKLRAEIKALRQELGDQQAKIDSQLSRLEAVLQRLNSGTTQAAVYQPSGR